MFFLNRVSLVSVYRYFRFQQLPVLVSYHSLPYDFSLLSLSTHRSFLKAVSLEILIGSLPIDHFMPRREAVRSRCCVRAELWLLFLLCILCSDISLHKGHPSEDRGPSAFGRV